MIPPELEANILRLYHAEKWRVGTIAAQVGVHHSTVRRMLAQEGLPVGKCSRCRSIGDPYIPVPLLVYTILAHEDIRDELDKIRSDTVHIAKRDEPHRVADAIEEIFRSNPNP